MKLFSLISSVATIALLPLSGFADTHDSKKDVLLSGNEKIIGHQSNGSYQSSSTNMGYDSQGSRSDMQQVYPKMYLQSARGCYCENGPYFDVEFLWVRPVEDGLSYAWKITNPDVTTGSNARNIRVQDQDFSFEPGFRVGLGYNLGYDKWDIYVNYSWVYSYVRDSVSGVNSDGDGVIVGTLSLLPEGGGLTYSTFESARTRWQVQFNSWDLDIGRNCYVGQHFSFRPTWGLKAGLIRQHLNTYYDNISEANVQYSNVQVKGKTRYWGIGPKIGVDGNWELGAGFSIFGRAHAAAMYGEFTVKNRLQAIIDRNQQNAGINAGGTFHDSFYRLRPMTYLNLGLKWGRCFWNWMFFSMHVGWETQYWWQQMEFLSFKDITPDGDLSITGLNAGIRFDF